MSTPARRVLALLTAVLAGSALLTAPALAASPQPDSVVSGYAVIRPMCATHVTPGQFTCMVYRRIEVAKGTPGAHRYSMPAWTRGPSGGLTPAALAKAYGYNPRTPTSMTVAVVDWYGAPYVRKDLTNFDRHYGLPLETATSLRVVNENGAAAPLPAGDAQSSVETSLDVQALRAVCNHCRLLVVEASHSNSTYLARAEDTAVRLGAKVISNSFGTPESASYPIPASVYRAFNHPGIVITAASGDDGWGFWDYANDDPTGYSSYALHAASYPASQGAVVAVGGTQLKLNVDGSRASETVWNGNGVNDADGRSFGYALGASGGGCSTQFYPSYWQSTLHGYQATGCKRRLASDVAAVADPMTGFDMLDTYAVGGWLTVGGTSLSAPLIAGMYALAGGANGLPYPGRALYQNYRFRPGALYDVKSGGTGWCGGATTASCSAAAQTDGGVNNPNAVYRTPVDCSFPMGAVSTPPALNPTCNAVAGYDGPSGVGAPRSLLAFKSTAPRVAVYPQVQAHGRSSRVGIRVTRVVYGSTIARRSWSWGDGTSS